MVFKSNLVAHTEKLIRDGDRVEEVIAGVILNRGRMLAPRDTGDLIESGVVVKNPSGGRSVIFGGAEAPYGRLRHFVNNKNPQTLHYLQRAGDSVTKEPIKKYIDMAE